MHRVQGLEGAPLFCPEARPATSRSPPKCNEGAITAKDMKAVVVGIFNERRNMADSLRVSSARCDRSVHRGVGGHSHWQQRVLAFNCTAV